MEHPDGPLRGDDLEGGDDDLDDVDDLEVDEPDDLEIDGNRLVGAVPRSVLEYLAKSIVEDPESVVIDVDEGRGGGLNLALHVAPSDMGRIIGRRGRVVQAVRAVVRAAGAREGIDARVDVVD